MDRKTLEKLEFHKIIDMLQEHCGSVVGKEKAIELVPGKDFSEVQIALGETSEAKEILRLNPFFTLGGIRDIRDSVERATLGGVLNGEDFLEISDTCIAARKTKVFLSNLKGSYPLILEWGKGLGIFKSLETSINTAIAEDATILDTASDKLYSIRRKIKTGQGRIKERLESYIRNPHTVKYLQDPLVTIRGDRYCIPVKQEYRAQVPGMVHDQSASGATLFIEPMAVLDLNNDLKKLRIAENDEIALILKNLSQQVAELTSELLYTLSILGELDFIFAKGRLSKAMDGGTPILNEQGVIKLIQARHPLIKTGVVPIDVDLGENDRAMVITGPNTGGKTVTLKTIGLFHAMALSGLHVPAERGTIINVFHNIFADIGDEQSIEQSLSTFSSHLVNIVRIITELGPDTLVLLDELGAGTDPTEGAALAMAILEYLQGRQVQVVATTHYAELKVYAYNHPRIVNASVEFNVETLKPTYRLLMGVPGKSNAFLIARSLGLNEAIIERAGEFLTKDQVQVADLITNLELDQQASQKERKEAEALRRELEEIKGRLAQKEMDLKNKEGDIIRAAQEESLRVLQKTKDEMAGLYQEFKAGLAGESLNRQHQAWLSTKEKLHKREKNLLGSLPEKGYVGEAPRFVEPGEYVEIPKLNQKGYVLDPANSAGEVNVQVGIMKITVKLADLRITENLTEKQGSTQMGHLHREKSLQVVAEISLRGLLVDEALESLDKYLDDACIAGLREVRIIHGKGTGALRDAVTTHLRKHQQVKSFCLADYNEGGSGATKAQLNV